MNLNTKATPMRPVVLIVEDEFLIMEDVADVLESSGYPVLRAWNADEALSLLERRHDIGIIFTDVNMPGKIDGLTLAKKVQKQRPEIGLIITSGAVRAGELDLPDSGCFIPKPYPPQAVVRTIGQMLGQTSSRRH